MAERTCRFCGTTEDVDVEDDTDREFSTMVESKGMCKSCSESLKQKAKATVKVYEWTDR